MNIGNNPMYNWYKLIDDKLKAIDAAASAPPAWREAWRHSTRGQTSVLTRPEDEASPEERLAVWKAVRDAGDLPADAAFFLVADEIRVLTEIHLGKAMEQVERHVDKVWAECGFGDWRSKVAREAPSLQEFPQRCPEDWDRRYAEALTAHGEEEAARLYLADRGRFEERMKAGEAFFRPAGYDAEMLQDFIEHLTWTLRAEVFEHTPGSAAFDLEQFRQQARYKDKRGVFNLLPVVKLRDDTPSGMTEEQEEEVMERFDAYMAQKRAEQLGHLEALHEVLQEAMARLTGTVLDSPIPASKLLDGSLSGADEGAED